MSVSRKPKKQRILYSLRGKKSCPVNASIVYNNDYTYNSTITITGYRDDLINVQRIITVNQPMVRIQRETTVKPAAISDTGNYQQCMRCCGGYSACLLTRFIFKNRE